MHFGIVLNICEQIGGLTVTRENSTTYVGSKIVSQTAVKSAKSGEGGVMDMDWEEGFFIHKPLDNNTMPILWYCPLTR